MQALTEQETIDYLRSKGYPNVEAPASALEDLLHPGDLICVVPEEFKGGKAPPNICLLTEVVRVSRSIFRGKVDVMAARPTGRFMRLSLDSDGKAHYDEIGLASEKACYIAPADNFFIYGPGSYSTA